MKGKLEKKNIFFSRNNLILHFSSIIKLIIYLIINQSFSTNHNVICGDIYVKNDDFDAFIFYILD